MVEKKYTISTLDELKGEGTFRVSCDRIGGPHAFTMMQAMFEIGGAISEYYEPRIKPKMEDYNIHVRADVTGYDIVVGTQLKYVFLQFAVGRLKLPLLSLTLSLFCHTHFTTLCIGIVSLTCPEIVTLSRIGTS